MKFVYTGLESQGKTLFLAQLVRYLVKRNKRWRKNYGFTRLIYSNIQFSAEFYEKNADFIQYWKDMKEVIGLTGCDILWDEISSDFSALKKEPLSRGVNRWLRQGAKQGVHIYATAQEFHDIHLDFRRRVIECLNVIKLIGSPRGGLNLPPVRLIWGICLGWKVEIHPYNELEPKRASIIPSILFFGKSLCHIFDTHQIVESSEELPFQHIERKCEKYGQGCDYKKVIHK